MSNNNLEERTIEKRWYVMVSGPLLSCCAEAQKFGYEIEDRTQTGFLLHKSSSSEYAVLAPWHNDIHSWELIQFNYRPSYNESRTLPDWKPSRSDCI